MRKEDLFSATACMNGLLLTILLILGCQQREVRLPARWVEPTTGMTFVRVPAGEFQVGTPTGEAGHEEWERLHPVRISRPFYLGQTEVTRQQWSRILGNDPSALPPCPTCPVETVNYHRIEEFLALFSESTGESFRLPTEAEWEYACRAGTQAPFSTGAQLTTDQANFDGRYPYPGSPLGINRGSTTPAATFPPNAFGLYDMHGNVWEWTSDDMCPYEFIPDRTTIDPAGKCPTELRVIRGGSWIFNGDSARCGLRYTHRPQDDGPSLGFRVVWEGVAAGE